MIQATAQATVFNGTTRVYIVQIWAYKGPHQLWKDKQKIFQTKINKIWKIACSLKFSRVWKNTFLFIKTKVIDLIEKESAVNGALDGSTHPVKS